MDKDQKSLMFWQRKTYQMVFVVLWFLLIFLALKIGSYISEILLSFLIAILINYLLAKPVELLTKVIRIRILAITIMFIAMIATVSFAAVYILPIIGTQFIALKNAFPNILYEMELVFKAFREFLLNYQINIPVLNLSKAEFIQEIGNAITKFNFSSFGDFATVVFVGSINAIVYITLTLILSVYLLYDGDNVWKLFITPLAARTKQHFNGIKKKADASLYAYIFGQFQVAGLTASVMLVTYLILGTPYALLLGFTQLLEIIPVLGTWTAIIPCVTVVFLTSGPTKGFIAAAVYLFYSQVIRDQIVAPRIFGSMLGFHPIAIIFTMIIGAKVLGPIGIIIAIPVVAVANSVLDYFLELNRLKVNSCYSAE